MDRSAPQSRFCLTAQEVGTLDQCVRAALNAGQLPRVSGAHRWEHVAFQLGELDKIASKARDALDAATERAFLGVGHGG